MAHDFKRPNLPYENESLQNDKRYELLTRTNNRPPTDQMLDADINYLIDGMRILDQDIAGVSAGILPGADVAANANFLPTTDGEGNISWVDITDANVRNESLSGIKLLPQTITDREVKDGTIVANKIAPNAVTTIKILDENVTTNKLADDAVTTNKLANGAVTTDKISENAITNDEIADNSITTSKIIDSNVTLSKLAQEVLDFMNSLIPIGTTIEWSGTTTPSAIFKECNGQLLNRVTYSALFAVIGTTYGAGDGSTTFALPDRRGRTSVGIGSDNSTNGLITAATAAAISLGKTFGYETHTLDTTQIPPHNHGVLLNNTLFPGAGSLGYFLSNSGTPTVTDNTGGGLPHNNVQPSIFTRYYIRAI